MAWTQRFADDFTGDNGTALPAHNAAWVNTDNACTLNNGKVASNAGYGRAYLTTTLADKQAVQMAIYADGDGTQSILLRHASFGSTTNAFSGYRATWYAGTIRLFRRDDNTNETELWNDTLTRVDGDVLRLEADGDQITLLVNGSVKHTHTDAVWSSGQAGIYGFGSGFGDNLVVEDDGGGAAGGPPQVFYRRKR